MAITVSLSTAATTAAIAALFTAALGASTAAAQPAPAPGVAAAASRHPLAAAATPADADAQNFRAEHEIGRRFHFDPNNLPPPYTAPIVTDRSLIIPYTGQTLAVPPGFTAAPFATGLANLAACWCSPMATCW